MLRNRIYLGKVRYQQCTYDSTGRRLYTEPVQWFDGQHEPLNDEDLFERCQQVRAERCSHRQATSKYNPYLLRNLIYCHRCCSHPPVGETFRSNGKMRPQAQPGGKSRFYRCRARQMGYSCQQKGVPANGIEAEVANILLALKPVADWRQGITKAVGELLGERDLEERLQEIRAKIKRMDTRWDNGFISDEGEYLRNRLGLQQELEQLTPVPDDDLQQASDVLKNFAKHWRNSEGDEEARHRLVQLIVDRVYVRDQHVVAMTLHSTYHLVLGHKMNEPTDFSIGSSPQLYRCGPDGSRGSTGTSTVTFVPRHIAQQYLPRLEIAECGHERSSRGASL